MTIPIRIWVVGLLFAIGGATAIYEVILDATRGNVNINFAVCLLPVGIGLIKGKRRSLMWARVWIVLGYVICALMVVLAVLWPQNATASWFGTQIRGAAAVPYVIGLAFVVAALLGMVQRLLNSPVSRAYFVRGTTPAPGPTPAEDVQDYQPGE